MKRQRGPTNIRSHSAIPMPMEQATSRVSSATAITPKGQRGRIIEKVRIETGGAAGGERHEDHNKSTGRSNNSAGNN